MLLPHPPPPPPLSLQGIEPRVFRLPLSYVLQHIHPTQLTPSPTTVLAHFIFLLATHSIPSPAPHQRIFFFFCIGGTPIKDDTCVCDHLFYSPAAWAATFCLREFHLVYTVFLCDHATGCEAYSFTTDGYGIFNAPTNLGACRTHEGGSGTNRSAQALTRRDRKTVPHPALPRDRT